MSSYSGIVCRSSREGVECKFMMYLDYRITGCKYIPPHQNLYVLKSTSVTLFLNRCSSYHNAFISTYNIGYKWPYIGEYLRVATWNFILSLIKCQVSHRRPILHINFGGEVLFYLCLLCASPSILWRILHTLSGGLTDYSWIRRHTGRGNTTLKGTLSDAVGW